MIDTGRLLSSVGKMLCSVAVVGSLFASPALLAATPDPVAVITVLRAQDQAVLLIGERLVVAGRPFCAAGGRSTGMTVQLRGQYGGPYRAAAVTVLGVGDRPTVVGVAPQSAAQHAGLLPGDQIMAIDGHRFAPVRSTAAAGDYAPTQAALDVIDRELADGSGRLEISRSGQTLLLTLTPQPACHARFDVRAGSASNASSDGSYVQVSSDLVADAQGDGELAAILAHELAHNILRHPQRLKAREAGLSVRTTEVEADRLSVWLLDAAGFAPADAAVFWQRWGRAHDLGIFADRSHPGWRQRVVTIAAEAAAITALRATGAPMLPPPELRARPG